MNSYLKILDLNGYWISFWIIIAIPVLFVSIYILFSMGQNYNIVLIIKKASLKMGVYDYKTAFFERVKQKIVSFFKSNDVTNPHINMLLICLKKVNGWNQITTWYSCLYYALNFWSIAFAVFSIIVIGGNDNSELNLVCTVFTAVLLCSTLFLKFDHKWMVFKTVLSKARKETNNFVYCLDKCRNPRRLIKVYSNRIISLEENLKERELL